MADIMRASSFLPTIKCSDCGHDIEISRMADHICSAAPGGNSSQPPLPLKSKSPYEDTWGQVKAPSRKPTAPNPFQIDSRKANQSRPDTRNQLTPDSDTISARDFLGPSQSQSNYRPPSPSSSTGYASFAGNPFGNQSNSYGNQSNPYATPPYSSKDTSSSYSRNRPPSPARSPVSPISPIKEPPARTDSIASGPYASRSDSKVSHGALRSKPSGHLRAPSGDGHRGPIRMPSSEIFRVNDSTKQSVSNMDRWASPEAGTSHGSRPSTSRSNTGMRNGQTSHQRERMENRTYMDDRGRTNTSTRQPEMNLSGKNLPQRPADPAIIRDPSREPRSNGKHSREASESSNGRGRKPERKGFNNWFRSRSSSRSQRRTDGSLENAPPMPATRQLQSPFVAKNSHNHSYSTSSYGSISGSDARTSSSRTTPSSASSASHARQPSEDPISSGVFLTSKRYGARDNDSDDRYASTRGRLDPLRTNAPERRLPPTQHSRRPAQAESPHDPAIQKGLYPVSARLDEPYSYAQPPQTPTESRPQPNDKYNYNTPPKSRDGPTRKAPNAANKGHCRGCAEAITGKSIKAADGRLTGRYHKECFACKTCRAPFRTADFYVYDNHPYCEFHYHEKNGSLCESCDCGIEGQYLATEESSQKFHPECFTCIKCRTMLRDDYFEVNGMAYCEPHAYEAARKTRGMDGSGSGRNGGGSSRNIERRRTRMMMI